MNIAIKKLAMLEKEFIRREEDAKVSGLDSCPIDRDLKNKITELMDKVRLL